MNISDGLSLIKLIWKCIQALFWRKKNVLYVNSNKKIANIDKLKELLPLRDWKIIEVQDRLPTTKIHYGSHLIRMRYQLFQIRRNLSANKVIKYSGFASPMFAACDGYFLGDVANISFLDYDKSSNEYYAIDFQKPSNLNTGIEFPNNATAEINIIISSSFEIAPVKYDSSLTSFVFNERQTGRVTTDYLTRVYGFVKGVLVGSLKYDIKTIHIYIAAQQPVSFIIGTAIQAYTPPVKLYEYKQGRYSFYLDLTTLKVVEVAS